ncbi:MAG: hypothetical protein Q8P15_02950 [Nanoarchaeota archaeon]|nr:hypothetical protein [Nanoarchaeota archaeon]
MEVSDKTLEERFKEENSKRKLKKRLASLAIVGGIFLALNQNGFGKEKNYILGLGGVISAVTAIKYFDRLRKEDYEILSRPYQIEGNNIILDENQYSIDYNTFDSEKHFLN